MRDIKFRAWDKVHCRFLEDWCYKSGEGMYYEFRGTGGMAVPDNVSEIIIEQYTGLKDKSGVEIYCGSILDSFGGTKYKVFWEGGEYKTERLGELPDPKPFSLSTIRKIERLTKWDLEHHFEVIGSVHTHPELLK